MKIPVCAFHDVGSLTMGVLVSADCSRMFLFHLTHALPPCVRDIEQLELFFLARVLALWFPIVPLTWICNTRVLMLYSE
jgi:hypothetical protein